MVFQEPRLMPWLDVTGNILFGLDKRQRAQYPINELLELVGLTGFSAAYPHQLSGGMQSRVAIARVIACDPAVILMDEPFAALDNFNREAMQRELIRIETDTAQNALSLSPIIWMKRWFWAGALFSWRMAPSRGNGICPSGSIHETCWMKRLLLTRKKWWRF